MVSVSQDKRMPGARAGVRYALSPASLAMFYLVKMRTELALQFAYRGAVFIWFISLSMQPLVSIVVWTTVARSQGGSAGGFTTEEYAAYFVILMIVNQMTFMWHRWEMSYRVNTGFFSGMLLRPMHPIHNDVVENVSFKLISMVPLVPVAILLSVAFRADYAWTAGNALVFLPALLLAAGLRFIMEWTIGLAAFWITRTQSINMLLGMSSAFLAGQIAPLVLLPGWARALASILPFRWTVSFPVEIAMGRLGAGEIALGLAVQVGWIAICLVGLRLLWGRATRRYSAVGA